MPNKTCFLASAKWHALGGFQIARHHHHMKPHLAGFTQTSFAEVSLMYICNLFRSLKIRFMQKNQARLFIGGRCTHMPLHLSCTAHL
jgi:hypothetical protein